MADPVKVLRDAAYVGVGFGVLGVQRAQVRRREIERELGPLLAQARTGAGRLGSTLEAGANRLERQVDLALGGLEERLPTDAASAVHQVRMATRTAQDQLLGVLRGGRPAGA